VSDSGLLLVADVHGLAGSRAELRALLAELASGAAGEQGCMSFRVLGSDQQGEFVLLCTWADESAMRAHYQTPHYRRYREQVTELLARPSDVTVHRLAGSTHVLDPDPPDPGQLD
jgi:quinol monooxygenase YgiN